jgi:hypothetical protein
VGGQDFPVNSKALESSENKSIFVPSSNKLNMSGKYQYKNLAAKFFRFDIIHFDRQLNDIYQIE